MKFILLILVLVALAQIPQIRAELGETTSDCNPPCATCKNSLIIKSVNDTHFFFHLQDMDHITQKANSEDWADKMYIVRYHGEGQNKDIDIMVNLTINKEFPGTGTGYFHEKNPYGQPKDFFEEGVAMKFHTEQACVTCHGQENDQYRRAAPSCKCIEKYDEYKQHNSHVATRCEIKCSRTCADLQCTIENPDKCTQCHSDDYFLPECTTPKKNFIMRETEEGGYKYLSCMNKCDDCVGSIDRCVKCNGKHRNEQNNCECLHGYHDQLDYYTDCVECKETCKTCDSSWKCTSCYEEQNRYWNAHSGQCECKIGYDTHKDGDLTCKKCYQLSDACVFECPESTVQNEELGACEIIMYSHDSTLTFVLYCTLVLASVQLGACFVIKKKLDGHYNKYMNEYEKDAKIQQQRESIYDTLESYGSPKKKDSLNQSQSGKPLIQTSASSVDSEPSTMRKSGRSGKTVKKFD